MWSIRRATLNDAAAIAVIHVAAWQNAYRGLLPEAFLAAISFEGRLEARVQALSRETNDRWPIETWVIEEGGKLRGWAVVGPTRDEEEDSSQVGELFAIYLEPGCIGSGLGRELCTHVLGRLDERGFTQVTLWVLSGNTRTIRFYESAGFSPDGGAKVVAREDVELDERRYRRRLPLEP